MKQKCKEIYFDIDNFKCRQILTKFRRKKSAYSLRVIQKKHRSTLGFIIPGHHSTQKKVRPKLINNLQTTVVKEDMKM